MTDLSSSPMPIEGDLLDPTCTSHNLVGYARVSTRDQNPRRQVGALTQAVSSGAGRSADMLPTPAATVSP